MKKSMYFKKSLITFALTLLTAGSFFAQEIVYVYDSVRARPQDDLQPDLATTVQIFENEGYDVYLFQVRDLSVASSEVLDTLNNADMVYIGRAVASSNFDNQTKKDAWNGVTAPIMTGNMWALRNTRLNWFNTGDCSGQDAPPDSIISIDIIATNDYVFEGFSSPMDWWTGPFNWIGGAESVDAGNGEVLAVVSETVIPVFVRFEAGTEFYSGSVDQPAADRVFFGLDCDNYNDGDGLQYFNYSAYTDDGMEVFLREVGLLTGRINAIDNKNVQLSSNVYFDQATQNLVVEMEGLRKVEIIDINGRQVYSSIAIENKLNINFDFAKNGLYLVRLTNNSNQSMTTKFFKQ